MKTFLTIFVVIFAFFTLFSYSFKSFALTNSPLLITKIMVNPTSCDDNDCEWLQIYNNSDSIINLSDWTYNGNDLNEYELPPHQSLVIARELIDSDDTDLNSFETNWGNNSGVWGDDVSESFLAIDDTDLGVSINLSNTAGSVEFAQKTDPTVRSSYSWESNTAVGFSLNLTTLEWIAIDNEADLKPIVVIQSDPSFNIMVKVDNNEVNENQTLTLSPKSIEIALSDSPHATNNSLIFDSKISRNNEIVYSSTEPVFEYDFNDAGNYQVECKVTDSYSETKTLNFAIIIESPTPTNDLKVYLNEILPDPSAVDWNHDGTISDSSDEWIEFFNPNAESVLITKFFIADESTKDNPKAITIEKSIPANGYLVLFASELGITLNNTNEHIYLYDFSMNLIDEYSYSTSKPDNSFMKTADGTWEQSDQPTFESENAQNPTGDDDESNGDEDAGDEEDTIAEVNLESDNLVKFVDQIISIKGIVTVDKDLLGKNQFYVQAGNKALKVSLATGIDQKIKAGYELKLTGELRRSSNSELYLFVNESNDIEVIKENKEKIKKKEVKIKDINSDLVGVVINVKGVIVETSGSTFWIGEGSNKIKVRVKDSTGIKLARKTKGDYANVTGILAIDEINGEEVTYVIYPRYASDVVIASVKGSSTETLASTGTNLVYIITVILTIIVTNVITISKLLKYNILHTFQSLTYERA